VTVPPDGAAERPVPVRTILATIGLVLATVVVLYIVVETRRVLTWIVVAAFFAVALYPVVGWAQRRLLGGRRRALATFLVFLLVFVALAGIISAFAVPLAQEATKFAFQLPDIIEQARNGRGPVGRLLDRTDVL
jgi:predicted PurR-regulated permease PerM